MPKTMPRSSADYIQPLNINGMDGRMLRIGAANKKNKREILFVYGSHSSLERWWGLIQALTKYGSITAPDLPGFGGMDSYYTIGKKPTIDNMADYLASFVKLRYRRKKVVIVGLSYGFVIATRMLQRYPELSKKVTLLVSIAGFSHNDDFKFTKQRYITYTWGTKILSWRIPAFLFKNIALHPKVLRAAYSKTYLAKPKFANVSTPEEIEQILNIEVDLWRNNDPRTWAFTVNDFMHVDNCTQRVDVPLWHVGPKEDIYFDNHMIEQHMQVIFSNFNSDVLDMKEHAPSVMATEEEAAKLIPSKLRRHLGRMK